MPLPTRAIGETPIYAIGENPYTPHVLTAKQARFVSEFQVDLNATAAAIRSGCSPRSASVTASRWLRNANVAHAIKQAQGEASQRNELTQDWVISRLVLEADRHADDASSSTRIKALELLGKYLGIPGFATVVNNDNRTLNLNGLSVDELKALASYVRSR